MRILPEATNKALDKCVPGELVRPHFYGTGSLALVAEHQGHRFLVVLAGEWIEQPIYMKVNGDPSTPVLSYGTAYDFRIDHLNELEIRSSKRWGMSGSIMLLDNSVLMVVAPDSRMTGTGYYDLKTGQMVTLDVPTTVIAYRWEIVLMTLDPDFAPSVFKFIPKTPPV